MNRYAQDPVPCNVVTAPYPITPSQCLAPQCGPMTKEQIAQVMLTFKCFSKADLNRLEQIFFDKVFVSKNFLSCRCKTFSNIYMCQMHLLEYWRPNFLMLPRHQPTKHVGFTLKKPYFVAHFTIRQLR